MKKCTAQGIWNCVAYLILIMSFVYLAMLHWWLLYPYKTMTMHNLPYPVLTPEVQKGNNVTMRMEFTKHVDTPGLIDQSINCVNGDYISLLPVGTTRPAGYYDQKISLHIPYNAPTGECKIIFKIIHEVNPIRTIITNAESEYFTITE